MDERLWDAAELAVYLSCSRRSIYRAIRRDPGSIPHVRLPSGVLRFRPEQIRAWIDAGCPVAAGMQDEFTETPGDEATLARRNDKGKGQPKPSSAILEHPDR